MSPGLRPCDKTSAARCASLITAGAAILPLYPSSGDTGTIGVNLVRAAPPTGTPPAVGCAVHTNFARNDAPYGNNAGTSRH